MYCSSVAYLTAGSPSSSHTSSPQSESLRAVSSSPPLCQARSINDRLVRGNMAEMPRLRAESMSNLLVRQIMRFLCCSVQAYRFSSSDNVMTRASDAGSTMERTRMNGEQEWGWGGGKFKGDAGNRKRLLVCHGGL